MLGLQISFVKKHLFLGVSFIFFIFIFFHFHLGQNENEKTTEWSQAKSKWHLQHQQLPPPRWKRIYPRRACWICFQSRMDSMRVCWNLVFFLVVSPLTTLTSLKHPFFYIHVHVPLLLLSTPQSKPKWNWFQAKSWPSGADVFCTWPPLGRS